MKKQKSLPIYKKNMKPKDYFKMKGLIKTEWAYCNSEFNSICLINNVAVANELNEEFCNYCLFLMIASLRGEDHEADPNEAAFMHSDFSSLLVDRFGWDSLKLGIPNVTAIELLIAYANILHEHNREHNPKPIVRIECTNRYVLSDLPETEKYLKRNNLS